MLAKPQEQGHVVAQPGRVEEGQVEPAWRQGRQEPRHHALHGGYRPAEAIALGCEQQGAAPVQGQQGGQHEAQRRATHPEERGRLGVLEGEGSEAHGRRRRGGRTPVTPGRVLPSGAGEATDVEEGLALSLEPRGKWCESQSELCGRTLTLRPGLGALLGAATPGGLHPLVQAVPEVPSLGVDAVLQAPVALSRRGPGQQVLERAYHQTDRSQNS